ncbi:hypothetical protein BHE74_00001928 [Ensete ventricosum]|nr:hypothetical protein GW17_00037651 [Ensete ventricosum]RWW89101.1 hypothetical protein BHE74_00001928 [Ensete ventricosum]RZR76428.1 hypothetical protein BHM03_00001176 [Ensete ventricosum]
MHACIHPLVFSVVVLVGISTVVHGTAGDGDGEEGGGAVAGHDDEEPLLGEGGVLPGGGVAVLLMVRLFGAVTGLQETGKLPVGAGKNE